YKVRWSTSRTSHSWPRSPSISARMRARSSVASTTGRKDPSGNGKRLRVDVLTWYKLNGAGVLSRPRHLFEALVALAVLTHALERLMSGTAEPVTQRHPCRKPRTDENPRQA